MLVLISKLASLGSGAVLANGPERIASTLVESGFVDRDVATVVANAIIATADSDDVTVLDYLGNNGFSKLISFVNSAHGIPSPSMPIVPCKHCGEFVNPLSSATSLVSTIREKTDNPGIISLLNAVQPLLVEGQTVEQLATKVALVLRDRANRPVAPRERLISCKHCGESFLLTF